MLHNLTMDSSACHLKCVYYGGITNDSVVQDCSDVCISTRKAGFPL